VIDGGPDTPRGMGNFGGAPCDASFCRNSSLLSLQCADLQTEGDDGNSGVLRSDVEFVDDGFDEVENQLPVVDAASLVVANTRRVVDQEHDVSHARCTTQQDPDAGNSRVAECRCQQTKPGFRAFPVIEATPMIPNNFQGMSLLSLYYN